ncbi:MAG: hypothetical protein H5U40_08275, partial [Polyangiaceae bacterium]|nr:hypothetical protein [Polyangiaceae bacterium]
MTGVVYGVGEDGLVASWDGGASRPVELPEGSDQFGVAHRDLAVAVTADGRASISADQGRTWTDTNATAVRPPAADRGLEFLPCTAQGCVVGTAWVGAAPERESASTVPVRSRAEPPTSIVRPERVRFTCEVDEPHATSRRDSSCDREDANVVQRFMRAGAMVIVEASGGGRHRVVVRGADRQGPFEYAFAWGPFDARRDRLDPIGVSRHAAVILHAQATRAGIDVTHFLVGPRTEPRQISFDL